MSDSLQPHRLKQTRLPCPSLSPIVCSNSCPLSRWCHSIISSSVTLFSSCSWSFPVSGSFPMSQLLASGSQRIGASASASVLPMNIQGFFGTWEMFWEEVREKGNWANSVPETNRERVDGCCQIQKKGVCWPRGLPSKGSKSLWADC